MGKVVYVHGLLPVFQHERGDLASFRLFNSQMIANGSVRHSEIERTFGVPLATVKRYVMRSVLLCGVCAAQQSPIPIFSWMIC